MKDYIIFDLETSGRNSKTAEIIEIAALKIIDDNIVDTFSSLVKPTAPIPASATLINGITNDMVSTASSASDVLFSFLEFIEDYTLVGHNISSFDLHIIKRYCQDLFDVDFSHSSVDTLPLARHKLNLENYKLSTIAEHFSVDCTKAHRALADCYITYHCFTKLQTLPDIKPAPSKSSSKSHAPIFSEATKALQTLQGFLLGIIADNHLADSEIFALNDWLLSHQDLAGNYPFDRVYELMDDVLCDGVITSEERERLLKLFKDFTNPIESSSCNSEISILGKHFCLSGEFDMGKADLTKKIEERGGTCHNSVTKKVDFLIVGGHGSANWSCGNYGSKVKKALEYQDKGIPVQIVTEETFLNRIQEEPSLDYLQEELPLDCPKEAASDMFTSKLSVLLDSLINEYDLPEGSICFRRNLSKAGKETSKSLCISEPGYPVPSLGRNNYLVFNFKDSGNTIDIIVRISQHDSINITYDCISCRNDENFYYLKFSKDNPTVLDYFKESIIYCLSLYKSSNTFGCCSRFNECSDSGKCLHPNKLYATGCAYKKNLDSGNIFYGTSKQ